MISPIYPHPQQFFWGINLSSSTKVIPNLLSFPFFFDRKTTTTSREFFLGTKDHGDQSGPWSPKALGFFMLSWLLLPVTLLIPPKSAENLRCWAFQLLKRAPGHILHGITLEDKAIKRNNQPGPHPVTSCAGNLAVEGCPSIVDLTDLPIKSHHFPYLYAPQ
jgi:hypothetical protein